MKIYKVINNNVLSAYDEQNRELVLMGRGIGFKAKPGDLIDESKIEKTFCIENSAQLRQFQELISHMPLEHMQISADIISYAKNECNMKLNQSIYIALTDHINFAIERYKAGVQLPNALLREIRQFYHQEYLVGEYALRLIGKRLDIHFAEDEAGFIALHFLNAEYEKDIREIYTITDMIQNALAVVHEEYGELDETTVHYERFVAHLKAFARRFCRQELLAADEPELVALIAEKYPREYTCGCKVVAYIEEEYGKAVMEEEAAYMAIHIRRIIKTDDVKKS